jgi:hypothetical protein
MADSLRVLSRFQKTSAIKLEEANGELTVSCPHDRRSQTNHRRNFCGDLMPFC